VTNVQSWLLLFLCFGILWLAVKEGDRRVDSLLTRFHTSRRWTWDDQHDVFDDEDGCPCGQDRNYHDRMAS
jgi:hypothetical protein